MTVEQSVESEIAPLAAYDPHYDPLVSEGPGTNRQYAPTYWTDTAVPAPEDDGPVMGNIACEPQRGGHFYIAHR